MAFTQPGSTESVDTIQLKALGKHPAEELPLFSDITGGEVCGQVKITALQGKLDHQGVRVQLIGVVELAHAGVKNQEFLSLCASPDHIYCSCTCPCLTCGRTLWQLRRHEQK